MKTVKTKLEAFAWSCLVVLGTFALFGTSWAQSVSTLQLVPSVIAGGSGGSVTAIVTLTTAAPVGGTAVAIASSNPELAASVPQVIVAAGQTTASFPIATNAQYRRYSGLAFSSAISAVTPLNGASVAATLNVTAQARPSEVVFAPPFSTRGPRCGAGEAGLLFTGETGTLWNCDEGSNAVCTFVQECTLGCETRPLKGTRKQDVCASAGPAPIAVNPKTIVGGNKGALTLRLASGAPAGSVGAVTSKSLFAAPPNTQRYVDLPFATGASSLNLGLLTAAVNRIEFAPLRGEVVTPQPQAGGGIFYASRSARTWVAVVPGTPPPVRLVSLALDTSSLAGGGPTFGNTCVDQLFSAPDVSSIALTISSSHPAVASVLPPQQNQGADCQSFGVDSVAVTTDTAVTIRSQLGTQALAAPLLVTAKPSSSQVSSFFLDPLSVTGGQSTVATLVLNGPAPASGFVVSLSSDNAAASPPASVTVPAGADRAKVSIGTRAVAADVLVTLRATPSSSVLIAQLSVLAPAGAPTLSSLAVNPSSVVGGTTSTGIVTLSAPAAAGVVVELASNASAAAVPPSVTVAAGASTAQFVVNTLPVAATTSVTLSATLGGIGTGSVSKIAALSVTPSVSPAPGSLPAPSLLSPVSDARFPVGQAINFDWSDVNGAASYIIQLDETDTFAAPLLVNLRVPASQYLAQALPASRPFWRVRAVDAAGNPGAWSVTRNLRVE